MMDSNENELLTETNIMSSSKEPTIQPEAVKAKFEEFLSLLDKFQEQKNSPYHEYEYGISRALSEEYPHLVNDMDYIVDSAKTKEQTQTKSLAEALRHVRPKELEKLNRVVELAIDEQLSRDHSDTSWEFSNTAILKVSRDIARANYKRVTTGNFTLDEDD